jgi:hypothetical protein
VDEEVEKRNKMTIESYLRTNEKEGLIPLF